MLDRLKSKIKKDLTGNCKQDFLYLERQKRNYAEHELSKEIIFELELIQYSILPDEKQAILFNENDEAHEEYKKEIDIAITLAGKKKLTEAGAILSGLVKFYETTGIYKDDLANEYRKFHNHLENLLYRYYFKSNRQIVHIDDPYLSFLYITYAEILFKDKKTEHVVQMMKKALKINPVDTTVMLSLCDFYKKSQKLDELYKLSKQLLLYAYTSNHVASAYRNIAYYFNELEQYEEAIAACCISYQYDKHSPVISSQLGNIKSKLGSKFSIPKIEKIEKIFAENDIQFGMPNVTRHYLITLIERYTPRELENLQTYYINIFNDIHRTYDDFKNTKIPG